MAMNALSKFKFKQKEVLYNKLLEKAISLMVQQLIHFYEKDKTG